VRIVYRAKVQLISRATLRASGARGAINSGLEKDGRKRRWEIEMDDRTVRAALERHWSASDAGDFDVEHEIYREDDYPQSGERTSWNSAKDWWPKRNFSLIGLTRHPRLHILSSEWTMHLPPSSPEQTI